MNRPPPLSPEEIALLQALSNAALAYLLMRRLDHPTGAREVARLLSIDEKTAAKYLRTLAALNLAARCGYKQGYMLLEGSEGDRPFPLPQIEANAGAGLERPKDTARISQDPACEGTRDNSRERSGATSPRPLSRKKAHHPARKGINSRHPPRAARPGASQLRAHNGKISRHPPGDGPAGIPQHPSQTGKNTQHPAGKRKKSQHAVNTTTTDIKLINTSSDSEVVVEDQNSKNPQNRSPGWNSELWHELSAAGIGSNPRTQALARQPHVSPQYVRAHRLKLEASGKRGPKWAGLLVTILESGEPAPELNPNGHLADCMCLDCHTYKMIRSWEDP